MAREREYVAAAYCLSYPGASPSREPARASLSACQLSAVDRE